MAERDTLMLGAVAYDPKVVTIWEGFKEYFIRHGLPFDYVLYSNYERQVEANLAGHIDIAWNSPLAWVQEERLARARTGSTGLARPAVTVEVVLVGSGRPVDGAVVAQRGSAVLDALAQDLPDGGEQTLCRGPRHRSGSGVEPRPP